MASNDRKGSESKLDTKRNSRTSRSSTSSTDRRDALSHSQSLKAQDGASAKPTDTVVDNTICPDCKKRCNDNDQAIECEFCERWYHRACQKVSIKFYEAIVEDSRTGSGIIHWYCNSSCNMFAKKVMGSMFSLRKDLDSVIGAVDSMDKRLGKVETGEISEQFTEKIRQIAREENKEERVNEQIERLENLRETLEGSAEENLSDRCKQLQSVSKFMDDKAKEQQRELEDRERRQRNLIIFDIPESTAENGYDKKKDDKEKVNLILEEIGVEKEPVYMRRLFKRNQRERKNSSGSERENEGGQESQASENTNNEKRNAPMLIIFDKQATRDEVIQKFIAAKKDAEEDNYEGEEDRLYLQVRIKRDMTQLERREDSERHQELKRMKEISKNEGDTHAKWVLRRGRVVNIGRYPRRRMQRGFQEGH